MKKSILFYLTIPVLLLTGCASGYREIKPASLTYQTKTEENNTQIEYQTNLLDGKYAANERKVGLTLVAVKITNNTGHDISIRNNLKIYAGDKELSIATLNNFYELTRQDASKSLWFLALAPVNVYGFNQTSSGSSITSQSSSFYPIGIILGPALAFGNQAAANGANRRYKKELDNNDLSEKTILTGRTEYGLIAINGSPIQALTFKII